MAQAKSISLSHFTAAVQSAVKDAVQKHPKFKVDIPKGIEFAYLIRGIPIPDGLLTTVTVGETQAFANEVAGHLSEFSGGTAARAVGSHGVIYSTGGHIIVGIPPAEVFLLEQ
jgi:hypothetical protein